VEASAPAPAPVAAAPEPKPEPVVEAAPPAPPPVVPTAAPRNGGDKRAMAAKVRVLLVAWGQSRASDWAEGLAEAGYDVHLETSQRASAFQWANEHQPAAVVIDLSTQPDDGRRLASTLKVTGTTAAIPVLFSDAAESGRAPLTSVDALLGSLSKI
jgi:CheY-like chemotaxis protein